MKRIAHRLYLDTNVYIFGRPIERSNSRIILNLAKTGVVTIIVSDTLISEVKEVFTRLYGKEAGKYARFYIESFPNKQKVDVLEIVKERKKYAPYAREEDLDHLTAAKLGGAEYFITTDRDFVESKAKTVINILTPKKFIELIGIKPYDTSHEE